MPDASAVGRTAGQASSRTGRRPGNPDTRAAILAAAKSEFTTVGFDKTSIRGVAKVAGVDPALVHHYFDSKESLLIESLNIPIDPRQVVPPLTGLGVEGLGVRIATRFLSIWDDPELRTPLIGLVKASMVSDAAAGVLRDGLVRMVLGPIAEVVGTDDALLRAQRVGSQMMGVIMARYVIGLQPLASETSADVVRWLAPTLQRYLDGEVPPA